MKYLFSILMLLATFTAIQAQSPAQVVGRSMVLKTNGHPDSIPSLDVPPVNFGNVVVHDITTDLLYNFQYADSTWVAQANLAYVDSFSFIKEYASVDAAALTGVSNGTIIYVLDAANGFASIGNYIYEDGGWVKL